MGTRPGIRTLWWRWRTRAKRGVVNKYKTRVLKSMIRFFGVHCVPFPILDSIHSMT